MNKAVRDKVVSRQNALSHNRSKASTLIGQLAIYYLPMGEWWWKLARTQSCTYHFQYDYIFLPQGLHRKIFLLTLKESLQRR